MLVTLSDPVPWFPIPSTSSRLRPPDSTSTTPPLGPTAISRAYDLPREFVEFSNASLQGRRAEGKGKERANLRDSLLVTSRSLGYPSRSFNPSSTRPANCLGLDSLSRHSVADATFSKRLDEAVGTTHARGRRRAQHDSDRSRQLPPSLNELTWSGATLEWYRNGTLHRTFDYRDEEGAGPIVQGLFCSFRESGRTPEVEPGPQEPDGPEDPPRARAADRKQRDRDEVWGPYRSKNRTEWSDEALSLPVEPPLPSGASPASGRRRRSPVQLRPYLLIILSTVAFLHPLDPANETTPAPFSSSSSNSGTGAGIPIHLPFRVRRAWNAPRGGILVEREREGHEALGTSDAPDDADTRVPVVWSLTRGAYGEFVPVVVRPMSAVGTSAGRNGNGIGIGGGATIEDEAGPLRDLDEEIVCVSSGTDGSTTDEAGRRIDVVVTKNDRRGKVTVWQSEGIEGSEHFLPDEVDEFGQTARTDGERLAPDDTQRTEDVSTGAIPMASSAETSPTATRANQFLPGSSLRRSRTSLAATSATPGSGLASREAQRAATTGSMSTAARRRVSNAASGRFAADPNEAGLLEALAANAPPHHGLAHPSSHQAHPASGQQSRLHHHSTPNDRPALRRGLSHNHPDPVSPETRRTSLTRNDLSVTMDRMALSQGSSVGGGPGGPPGGIGNVTLNGNGVGLGFGGGDMDREATMFVDEQEWATRNERRGARSEVRWHAIWEGDLAGSSTEGIEAHVFDRRSPDQATLSILLPSSRSLVLLSLSRRDGDEDTSCSILKQTSAKSSCVVSATRPNVRDLLVLRDDGTSGLITASGIELDLDLGTAVRCADRVVSDGHSRVLASLGTTADSPDALSRRMLSTISTALAAGSTLALRVLEVLARVLQLSDFEEVLKAASSGSRNSRPDGFERVRQTLEELFGLVESESEDEQGRRCSAWDEMMRQDRIDPLGSFISEQLDASGVTAQRTQGSSRRPATFNPAHFAILVSLHLLVENLRLRFSTLPDATALAKLVFRLAQAVGARGWIDQYKRNWGSAVCSGGRDMTGLPTAVFPLAFPETPPSIVSHLSRYLTCPIEKNPATAFSLTDVAASFGCPAPSDYFGDTSDPLATLDRLVDVYSLLTPSGAVTPTVRAQQCARRYHELGGDLSTLNDTPFGIALPIREAIRSCQLEPPERANFVGTDGFWTLIGRRELERPEVRSLGSPGQPTKSRSPVDIDVIVQDADRSLTGADSLVATTKSSRDEDERSSLNPIPRAARFNEDKRLEEVARMLQFVEPVIISPGEKTLDQLTPQAQQLILSALSHRTLALPIGAGAFHFANHDRAPTDALEIPRINTSARILPMPSPVALAEKEPRDPTSAGLADRFEWPEFHSGVAAALRLRFDEDEAVDSSQISFNRPSDLDARHAGLLMGLGLIGKLGSMLSSQAYDYLKAKHDPTSVGILLGLAVTFLGTCDPTVTSVVSIHLPALHPPRSSSLNVSGMTKAAAAVSLGFVHFATGRRTFADIFVRELCAVRVTTVEDAAICREAYALSCGFAFGFIMLGRGKDKSSAAWEVDLLRVFRALILGEHNRPLPGAFNPPSSGGPIDVSITTSAATVGLALMFLRTNRQDVADIFEIPDTPGRLDYVRPDLLLLRTLAGSLVMWNDIAASKEWIESRLPKFIVDAAARQQADPTKPMDPDWEIARWSLIAGACFAIGFKYAGTATAEAHATLIHYMDRLTRASYAKVPTIQGKIKRHALRSSLGVVSIALAMVMAGTGELNVLRRLRVAHGHFSEGISYGHHVATHLALGLLFMGEAKYTLSNSDGAVATLLLALYPSFPSTSSENRTHLQAYRHLWVLAAEPRYLEARDIDTNEPVFLPVRLRLAEDVDDASRGDLKAKSLVAPTLIPDVRLLESIQIESPRYWSYAIRFSSAPRQFAAFLENSTIWVKRRTGHLSYAQDPRGVRSIFTRSKSEVGSSVTDFGERLKLLSPSASGLRDFVAAFSDDAEAIAATERLCLPADADRSPTEFEAFCAAVLLECLVKDKRDMTGVYLSMFQAHTILSAASPASDSIWAYEQLRLVVDFYLGGAFKSLFGRTSAIKSKATSTSPSLSSTREPLVSIPFVDHVSLSFSKRIRDVVAPTASMSTYLASTDPSFPTDPTSATELALQLAHHAVPDLTAVERLKELVKTALGRGASRDEVNLMLKRTAKTIAGSGKRAWTSEVSDLLSSL
ncbi:hypothetical protein JCM10212_001811 [Sporobolomyces blumeae]